MTLNKVDPSTETTIIPVDRAARDIFSVPIDRRKKAICVHAAESGLYACIPLRQLIERTLEKSRNKLKRIRLKLVFLTLRESLRQSQIARTRRGMICDR